MSLIRDMFRSLVGQMRFTSEEIQAQIPGGQLTRVIVTGDVKFLANGNGAVVEGEVTLHAQPAAEVHASLGITSLARVMRGKIPGPITPAELERLAWLAEECAEVIQAVQKVIRFGYEDKYPGTEVTAREHLQGEVEDVLAVIGEMSRVDDLEAEDLVQRYDVALTERIDKKLRHSRHQQAKEA